MRKIAGGGGGAHAACGDVFAVGVGISYRRSSNQAAPLGLSSLLRHIRPTATTRLSESTMTRWAPWDALWHRCLLLFAVACFCRWSPTACSSGHVQQSLFVHSFSVSSLSTISSTGSRRSVHGPFAYTYLPAHDVEQRRIHAHAHGSMQQHPPSASALRSSSSDNDDDTTPPNIDLTSYATPQESSKLPICAQS